MIDGLDGRRWWSVNGVYVALFFALMISQVGYGRAAIFAFVLSMSGILSLATLLRWIENRSSLAFWWVRSIVGWLSWWMLNLLPTTLLTVPVGVFLFSALQVSESYFSTLVSLFVALPPSLVSVKHIITDYHAARHAHGSIAEAGRAMRNADPKFAWQGFLL